MDNFYIILVVILFSLAISDLIVGVSNDAVNFLNSAIGSKVASFKIIIAVAALGILAGTTFSSGMMEVARKGIFHPQAFYFSEIMVIFLAVMISDVLLLDTFNTFGMPTSTTVSIVFELLGAAVSVSTIKIVQAGETFAEMSRFINSGKALAIISGILLSVVVAFTVGAVVQYIARLIFSFNYEKAIKRYGSIFGGLAISAITYFILIKGANGSSFMTDANKHFIQDKSNWILLYSFLGWTILIQILRWLFKLDVLKFIVLMGTFAIAMAFAGNDLVNFIGVPLAGFESFKAWFYDGAQADPHSFLMVALEEKVKTSTYFLIFAGLIMVATLYFSRKAKSVIKTSVDLARQSEGDERFGSSFFARSIVRWSFGLSLGINAILPGSVKRFIKKQFDNSRIEKSKGKDGTSFDMIRAAINMIVASILISFATSLKLPLSTTYVTFMVAMGTSLSDGAWGRESAVFRITGVISVIGGWFFTAFAAFSMAFILAQIIFWGGKIAIALLILIAISLIYRSHRSHKKKMQAKTEADKDIISKNDEEIKDANIFDHCSVTVIEMLEDVKNLYVEIIKGVSKEKRKKLILALAEVKKLNKRAKKLKDKQNLTIARLEENFIETGHYYVQVLDYLREIAHCITYISTPSFEHIDNNHKGLTLDQTKDLLQLKNDVVEYIDFIRFVIKEKKYEDINEIINRQQDLVSEINDLRKKQIKRIKAAETGTRVSLLFMDILSETKNMVLHALNLLKAQRDFVVEHKDEFNV